MELRTPETDEIDRAMPPVARLYLRQQCNGRTATATRSLELNENNSVHQSRIQGICRQLSDRMERTINGDSIVFSTTKTITFRMADTAQVDSNADTSLHPQKPLDLW
ncbi:MAG: hypothetical protein ACLRS8_14575 [Parabacteroides merdae]